MSFLNWINDLGEKNSRTDVWVVLYTLITLASAFLFFACGIGFINHCSDSFTTANTILLTTCLAGIMVDFGMKRLSVGRDQTDEIVKTLLEKIKNQNDDNNN